MKTLSRFFHQLCTVYTVGVLLLLLLNIALGSSPTQTTVNTAAFLWLFVFAALLAVANMQLTRAWCAYVFRVLLHCVVAVVGAFCLLYLPWNAQAVSSNKLLMLCLMLVVYWIIMALYLVIFRPIGERVTAATSTKDAQKSAKGGKGDQKQPYRSLFGGSSED